jgi:predicted phage tail protein
VTKKIKGSGGEGDYGEGPAYADGDTLRSKQIARMVDLVCEGPIHGLVNGDKSIYFNEVPLERANGKRNFKGISYRIRTGTQDQSYLSGFSSVEREITVGEKVNFGTPVVRTITDPEVDAVRVTIAAPQLLFRADDGQTAGVFVQFKIDVQSNGGGYAPATSKNFIGKSTGKYQRSFRIDLTGDAPWDIRVTRELNAPPENQVSDIYLESYTEIIDAKLRYPNTAVIGLNIDSSSFRAIPDRAYDLKLLKISIPSNATVRDDGSLIYSGTWDGEFQTAWSSNPAWVFWDLITNTRYGLGSYIPANQVDKWGLYTIGRYCDELVSDGRGGQEPRFSCNLFLQAREEAYKVLFDLASCFRSMIYWAGGTIHVVQDAPADPVYLYTGANVLDGTFVYQGSSAKTRFNTALVSYNDPNDFYRPKVEYVEDAESIAQNGIIETEVFAFGCSSRSQANRLGRWILFSSKYESETLSFKTGLEGAVARPGQIISVADPMRSGVRLGGRISTATTTVITIDAEPTVDVVGGALYCLLPDGTVENRTITAIDGVEITVNSAFTTAPANQSMWVIATDAVALQLFRVLTVVEGSDGFYEIGAIKHVEGKYDFVEDGIELEDRGISALNIEPSTPENLTLSESLYQSQNDVRVKLTISWDRVLNATGYYVSYVVDDGNQINLPEVSTNEVDVLDVQPGVYTAYVYSVNSLGKRSVETEATYEVLGKTAPPADVTGFSLVPLAGRAELQWDLATDLDVLVGGWVEIRWSPLTSGALWKNGVDISQTISGSNTRANTPLLNGTYMARFVDSSGFYSENEALIVTTVPEALTLNVVETITEDPLFEGRKVNVSADTVAGILSLSSDGMIDDFTDLIDELESIDYFSGVLSSGTYYFAETFDLGAVYTSRLTLGLQVAGEYIFDYIDSRSGLVDDWDDIDGGRIDGLSAKVSMRTCENNPFYEIDRNSIGSFYNNLGLIEIAGVDEPRLNHDPSDLSIEPTILVEASSTNQCIQSENFSTSWGTTTNYTRTANAAVSPDGTTNAYKIGAIAGQSNFNTSAPLQIFDKGTTSSITVTFSIYAKAAEYSFLRIRMSDSTAANAVGGFFGLSDNTITNATIGSLYTLIQNSIEDVGNGWKRCIVTCTTDSVESSTRVRLYSYQSASTAGTNPGGSGIYIWGAQTEFASSASSYIPTTTVTVTREADIVTSTPDWTPWKPFFVSEYKARGFEFKMDLRSEETTQNILVSDLSVTIDMPDRIEQGRNVDSTVSGITVEFDKPFYDTPSIGLTAYNMATGDYYEVSGQDEEEFTVVFKNSAGTIVSRNFDWIAKGYGRKSN